MGNNDTGKALVKIKFCKYHALGNDYIVLDPAQISIRLNESRVQRICHRNYGIGSDGILLGPQDCKECDFAVRIYNPDGSEAEKSGNGLRIFSRYLFDCGLVKTKPFTILTAGGPVTVQIFEEGRLVKVDMGTVSFESTKIPVSGPPRAVLNEALELENKTFQFCAATVGNPHCVIIQDEVSVDTTRQFGPVIEIHPLFPNRTNVQFMQILDRNSIRIEIWERGAGYTLASGSSSSAAAAVAYKLGLCDSRITVRMPGGNIEIEISPEYAITMTGPVTRVCEGYIDGEIFNG